MAAIAWRPVVEMAAQLVEFRVDAGGDCAAVDKGQRWFGDERGFDQRGGHFIEDIEARG